MNANRFTNRRRFLLPLSSACALCAGLAFPAIAQDQGTPPGVEVTDYGVVDISVQDADLAQVLQMLSMQSRKNIITSKSVSATVTANLFDVTFYEALDAILRVNGYAYEEVGNFIYVYTQEELDKKREAQRKTVSRTFELEHLSSVDANEFIQPLLSDKGSASHRGEVQSGFKPDVANGGEDSYAFSARLVVNDYPENLDRIAELLNELDTPPQQVLVEATILQTAVDEANAFGIDFSVIGSFNFTDIIAPLNPVNALLGGSSPEGGFQPENDRGRAVNTNVGNTSGPGGLKVGIVHDNVSVFLRVLDEVTDTTILARPKIMALNRQRAEVLVGARVGFLSTTATETTTTQTVDFLDTGIQLIFRPFISRDGTIRMELRPSVSEARLRTVTDAGGVQVTIPDELTNELTTNVRIRDGQTLVLGGLFKETTRVTRRQVPVLGDIPVLGAAFRGQDDSVVRDEIIFMITPTITHDQTLWENGEEMLSVAEMATIGARSGLLPFSRDKMTSSYNQSAMKAAGDGDVELALYHINNSLRLNPQQPELINLRQKLSTEQESRYERSLLERVIRGDLRRQSAIAEDAVIRAQQRALEVDPMASSSSDDAGRALADEPKVMQDLDLDLQMIDDDAQHGSDAPDGDVTPDDAPGDDVTSVDAPSETTSGDTQKSDTSASSDDEPSGSAPDDTVQLSDDPKAEKADGESRNLPKYYGPANEPAIDPDPASVSLDAAMGQADATEPANDQAHQPSDADIVRDTAESHEEAALEQSEIYFDEMNPQRFWLGQHAFSPNFWWAMRHLLPDASDLK